ncbi:MAG: DUF4235 domain-containing protein [Terracoccus sp.]
MSNMAWKALSVVSTIAATKIATNAAEKGWKLATGRSVPVKGDYEQERTRDVILFTALSSMLVMGARVAIERKTAEYYRNSTGHLPKDIEEAGLSKKERKQHRKLAKATNKTQKKAKALTS